MTDKIEWILAAFFTTQGPARANLITKQLYHLPYASYLIFNSSTRKPISTRDEKLLQDK